MAKILLTHGNSEYSLLEIEAKVEVSPEGETSTKLQVVSNEKIQVGKNLKGEKKTDMVHENPCILNKDLLVFSTTTFFGPGEVVLYSVKEKRIIDPIRVHGVIDAFAKGNLLYIAVARKKEDSDSSVDTPDADPVSTHSGIEIFDISNPTEPKFAGFIKKYVRSRDEVLLDDTTGVQDIYLLCDPCPSKVVGKKFEEVCDIEKRRIRRILKWNNQFVVAHRGVEPGRIQFISFFPLSKDSKDPTTPQFYSPDPIDDIFATEWGLVVVRNDMFDWFSPIGGIDIITKEGEEFRLESRAVGHQLSLRDNILTVSVNRRTRNGIDVDSKEDSEAADRREGRDSSKFKISYSVRIYDLISRKKIKAFDIPTFVQYLEIVNLGTKDKKELYVMFEDFDHIHFVGVHNDSHHKIEMKKISMGAKVVE